MSKSISRIARLRIFAAAVVACSGFESEAAAQCRSGYCRRPPARFFRYHSTPLFGPAIVYQRPIVSTPAATPQSVASPAVFATPRSSEAGAFLGALNAWRARHGRGPVVWDATLEAYAAVNSVAGHGANSRAPGSGQCWASDASLLGALAAWQQSPSHAAILLGATVSVGASRCPSGTTCNAR